MKLTRIKKKNKKLSKIKFSRFHYMWMVLSYILGFFSKKNNSYLESSKYLIKLSKKKWIRKPLVFPFQNPNSLIKNSISIYGKESFNRKDFKEERKKYLNSLSKKKQEDFSHNLRRYRRWKIYWPFYYVWIKFIRLFNFDLIFSKDSRYEFSNEQLQIFNERQEKNQKLLQKLFFLKWVIKYYSYLKEKILNKKYQRNNWIVFGVSACIHILVFSILISYSSYVVKGDITYPPFSNGISYPNFFFDKLGLAYAVIGLSATGIVLVFVPVIILLSLLFSNINDAHYNVIFVFTQQMIYLITGIFMFCAVSIELDLFFAH